MRTRVLIALFAAGALQAADPWIGRWRVISVKAEYEKPYRITISNDGSGLHLLASWSSTGTPKPAMLRRVDSSTAEYTPQPGNPAPPRRYTVSANGKELTESTRSESGKELRWVYDRVGEVRADSDRTVGVWQDNEGKSINEGNSLRIFELEENGRLHFTGAGVNYVADFDGKGHPFGNRANATVTLRRIDGRSFEETFQEKGKPYNVRTVTVSTDNSEMTFTIVGTYFGGAARRVLVMRRE